MKRRGRVLALGLIGLAIVGCTGGSAYVGVYGAPVYGPGPWGSYPGRYGPYGPYGGGGVWIGAPICCEEQQEEQQEPEPEATEGGENNDAQDSDAQENEGR